MKFFIYILSLIIPVYSVSICRNIEVAELGIPNGKYQSISDYRGRPDFYSINGGEFNLFGEDQDDGTCIWRKDSTETLFPYYETTDCSFHPNDIDGNAQWYLYQQNTPRIDVFPLFSCLREKESLSTTIITVIIVIVSIIVIILIVYMHIVLRKRRILRWEENCPTCVTRSSFSAVG